MWQIRQSSLSCVVFPLTHPGQQPRMRRVPVNTDEPCRTEPIWKIHCIVRRRRNPRPLLVDMCEGGGSDNVKAAAGRIGTELGMAYWNESNRQAMSNVIVLPTL